MLEFLRQLLTGTVQVWQRLGLNARVQIVLAGLLSIVVVIAMVLTNAQQQYVTLYAGLDTEDTAKIVNYLDSENVPYQLRDNETAILIPAGRPSQIRVRLEEQGLTPRKHGKLPGMELFDAQNAMSSQWLNDVNYTRAVQGELQRQLVMFDFVRGASVWIQESDDNLFISDSFPATASVTLDLERDMSPKEIKAVLGVVKAFGGYNLPERNITIVTTEGQVLKQAYDDEWTALANSRLDLQNEAEKRLENKIMTAFKGIGVNAMVTVHAKANFEHKEVQSKKIEDGLEISSWKTDTETSSHEGLPEGPAGARANVPQDLAGDQGLLTRQKVSETVKNIEPSVTTTTTVTEPGDIEKYIVSAIVEGTYEAPEGVDGGEADYVAMPDTRKEELRQFMASAAGTTLDDVTLFDMPFKTMTKAESVVTAPLYRNDMVLSIGRILAVLIAFMLILRFVRRAMVLPTEEEEEKVEIPAASAEDLRRKEVAMEVERLSNEQPEVVAAMLRSWLSSEE